MKYTRITMAYIDGPKDRFYRVVLVKGNPDLFELGTYLGLAVGAEFEHCFLISEVNSKSTYVMSPFMEEPMDGYKYLRNYHLSDLPSDFTYEYDTGENWNFICKKYKITVEVDSDQNIIIVDGKGQGIWEDNAHALHALFSGEIDPNATEDDEENGIYKPWNFEIEKFGDFDLPLNIKKMNNKLKKAPKIYKELLDGEIAYAKLNKVCLDDYNNPSNSFKFFNFKDE